MRASSSIVLSVLATLTAAAQGSGPAPVTAAPSAVVEARLGFRDWGPLTLAGTLILSGNATGRGGVVAVDTATAKQKWAFRPVIDGSVPQLHHPIVVDGARALAILDRVGDDALSSLDLATGKEAWRVMIPGGVQSRAGLAVSDGIVAVQTDAGTFVGYQVATGAEAWRTSLGARSLCGSVPAVREGLMYTTAGVRDMNAGSEQPGERVFAIDMKTGAVRWRARTDTQACAEGNVVVGDEAVFVSMEMDRTVYAFDRASGRRRWKREVRAIEEGRDRLQPVYGLTVAGRWIVGTMKFGLIALNATDGATAWQVPGAFAERLPPPAVAGRVLYFQGKPAGATARRDAGTLHALDLNTQRVLWSYTHPVNDEQNWSFGEPLAVDGAVWIATNGVLLKLQ